MPNWLKYIFDYVDKKHLCKVAVCFLVLILSLLLIFNAGFVDAFSAHAVVPAIAVGVGAYVLLTSILVACGFSFTSVSQSQAACDNLWSNMTSELQETINFKATSLAVTGLSFINFLSTEWSNIYTAITATWGVRTLGDISLSATNDDIANLLAGQDISIPVPSEFLSSSLFNYNLGSLSFTYYPFSFRDHIPDYILSHLTTSKEYNYCISSICNFDFVSSIYKSNPFLLVDGQSILTVSLYPSNHCISIGGQLYPEPYHGLSSRDIFFNGELLSFSYVVSSSFVLSTSAGNIVCDGYLRGTDIPVSDSICPDGIWNSINDFSDWLNGNIGNVAPGIDVNSYPGVDTWPAEKQADAIDDPAVWPDTSDWADSIDIAVPGTIEDAISTPRDVIREGTQTGDIDNTDTDTKPSGSNTLPPSLPNVFLPEVIFKDKFPFCLPWDIYNLFAGLKADAKPPKFLIPFKFDSLGIDYTIPIDFTDFDGIIKIIRFFLGAIFVLGLILLSRRLTGSE